MKRITDWEAALHSFARSQVGKPFVWGETNCISLSLRAIDAQCGTSLHEKGRHFMSSALRARAFVKKQGLAGLVKRLEAEGLVIVPANFERVGDVQLVETSETLGSSVILGRQHLSSSEAEGVRLYDGKLLQASITLGVR